MDDEQLAILLQSIGMVYDVMLEILGGMGQEGLERAIELRKMHEKGQLWFPPFATDLVGEGDVGEQA